MITQAMGTCYTWLFLACYLNQYVSEVMPWPDEWLPNYMSINKEVEPVHEFVSYRKARDILRVLLVEKDKVFIGGSNRLYYISIDDLSIISTLEWSSQAEAVDVCTELGMPHCDNYIRVVLREANDTLLVCGTNAHSPKCRHYKLTLTGSFQMMGSEEDGSYRCPHGATDSWTILHTDEFLFSATYKDSSKLCPIIAKMLSAKNRITTRMNDPSTLSEPTFVNSLQLDEYVYFFFREYALEDMQGEHVIYSRVARVCKGDGGDPYGSQSFTSYFKARIHCTIHGSPVFHFNEIQSMSELGKGTFNDVGGSDSTGQMFYGIFNTPVNSLWGSAVCAYKFKDVSDVFDKAFKGQNLSTHMWESVGPDKVPTPNLTKCDAGRKNLDVKTLFFIYQHPLMEAAVEPLTEMPVLIYSYSRSRLTQIAVDWRVSALDHQQYDILFLGTTDGRVIKAFNAWKKTHIETVVIEDFRVFPKSDAVLGLLIIRTPDPKLMVSSSHKVVSLPLHRCGVATDCSACVALRDPYCSWDTIKCMCDSNGLGLQDIDDGHHPLCRTNETMHEALPAPSRAESEINTIYTDVLSAIMTGTGVVIAVGVVIIIALQWSIEQEDSSLSDVTETPKNEVNSLIVTVEKATVRPIVENRGPPGSTWV